jgi:LysR family transcriptional regulator of beta-lactamase
MFADDLTAGRLVQPFVPQIATGGYWLTRLMSRKDSPAMAAFRDWLKDAAAA